MIGCALVTGDPDLHRARQAEAAGQYRVPEFFGYGHGLLHGCIPIGLRCDVRENKSLPRTCKAGEALGKTHGCDAEN